MPRVTSEPTVDWKISVPLSIAGAVELKLADPMRSRPIYGARARLIKHLLENWLREGAEIPTDPDEEYEKS